MTEYDKRRLRPLNDKPVGTAKSCVLYVMARDQRLSDNHALAAAQAQALELGVPLAVVFCLLPKSGYRAREHYAFMLDGLRQLEAGLRDNNIPLLMVIGDAAERLHGVMHHLQPAAVYFDFSPLRGPRRVRSTLAAEAACAVYEVDTHNIVPAWLASDKQEFGARTLRPKIQKQLAEFLNEAPSLRRHPFDWPGRVQSSQELRPRIDAVLGSLPANGSDTSLFTAGEQAAQAMLDGFVAHRLKGYAANRNNPTINGQSGLSPYTHFGQLSAASAVRAVLEHGPRHGVSQEDIDAFVEEITVRKELSDNFCLYNPRYDSLDGAPEWARRTLAKHADDPRPTVYDRQHLEAAKTHDPAWNAAQRHMMRTGKMHNYMRMYWAKKVLEWSASPAEAVDTLVYLNDFYHLDGGDPGGYVGILWSVAGLHDRPWGERPINGTVRSMVYAGLKRKFDIAAYERQWSAEA